MKEPKPPKFNFAEMKAGATSENVATRKKTFQEYFEQFEEFPSYLFDTSPEIDSRLLRTIEDINNDPTISSKMKKGIAVLMQRLSAGV